MRDYIYIHMRRRTHPWLARVTGLAPAKRFRVQYVHPEPPWPGDVNMNWRVEQPGLYETGSDVPHDHRFFIVYSHFYVLETCDIQLERARLIARRLDEGMSFDVARLTTGPPTIEEEGHHA